MHYLKRLWFLYILLITTIKTTTCEQNNTSTEHRQGRVNGYMMKLPSGPKTDPVMCPKEGFLADPVDCAVFYRCIKAFNGKYTVYRFQCGPGTVFDPDTDICNHPRNTKRSECGGIYNFNDKTVENEVEGTQELPTPITTKLPITIDSNIPKEKTTSNNYISTFSSVVTSTIYPWSTSKYIESHSTSTNHPSTTRTTYAVSNDLSTKWTSLSSSGTTPRQTTSTEKGEKCTKDGFMGDSENCRKFYRCVENNRKGFIRYEFLCSEPTIWDDDMQSCNHPWAVRRRRCGRVDDANNNILDNIINEPHSNYGDKIVHTQINNINNAPDNTHYNMHNDDIGFTKPSSLSTTTHETNSDKIMDNYYGNNHPPLELLNNYSNQFIPTALTTESNINTSTNKNLYNNVEIEKSTKSNIFDDKNQCSENGFIGDINDCKKFYRCVGNGRGTFMKYEFTCSQGTVWDARLGACNYAWAVHECGGNKKTESQIKDINKEISTQYPTTSQRPVTTLTDQDFSYGNTNTYDNKKVTRATTAKITYVPTEDNSLGVECSSSGFFGDTNDCQKFYRCIENGIGGFIKYTYECDEGTFWDPTTQSCNFADKVTSCSNFADSNKFPSTNNSGKITTIITQSTTKKYLHTNTHKSVSGTANNSVTMPMWSKPVISSTKRSTNKNICESSGFIGDNDDCKKFYRCVDNGDGSFVQYEFTCGEGTVWDPNTEACNHAWAVKSCGGRVDIERVTIALSTTMTNNEVDNNGYISQNILETTNNIRNLTSDYTTLRSTTRGADKASTTMNKNVCTKPGFRGDDQDCSKFYRCVDNGNGGYDQYDFRCGDGTVWDSKIEACNHKWAVEKCGQNDEPEIKEDLSSSSTEKISHSSTHTISSVEATPIQSSSETISQSQINDESCQSEGFYADIYDCRKFYRCVDNGRGNYTKYDFTCSDGTVWDQEIEACNHETSNSNCSSKPDSKPVKSEIETTSIANALQEMIRTTEYTKEYNNDLTPKENNCESDGFHANPNDCSKFYRCVDDGNDGYIRYDFSCADGTIWIQESQTCDHSTGITNCKTSISTTTQELLFTKGQSLKTTTSTTPSIASSTMKGEKDSDDNMECKTEGFHPNKKNCKEFYRCVYEGNGKYTKYDFTCGEGTAWDTSIQSCNHADKVENCSSYETSNSDPQANPSMQNQNENYESNDGSSTQSSSSTTTTTSTTKKPNNQDRCNEEGYFGNSEDCHKFYRCVSDQNGKFTKYDFSCGDGTIWDQNIIGCNHPENVANSSCKSVGASENTLTASTTMSSTNPHSSSSISSSETSNTQTSTESNKDTSNEPSNSNYTCSEAGFFPDPNDCKKFYRCVDWDNDGEGFSIFHFECGEGTIWDPSINTCNHENSVSPPRNCSNEQQQNQNVSQSSSEANEDSNNKPTNNNYTCNEAGFFPDPNDCKKFYRCVDWDNDGEGFSIFHFECGEGTIWDPSITTCNYEDSVYPPRNCNGAQQQNQNITEESTTNTNTESTYETTTQPYTSTTQKSTTQKSTTQTSSTQKSTTQQSTTQKSTTQSSTTQKSTTPSSTTQKSTTQSSTTQKSTTPSSTTQKSTTQSSTTQKSTTQSSTTQKSTTQSSTTQKSTTQTSTTQKSTTTKTTPQQTTTEESTSTTSQPTTTTIQSTTDETSTQTSTSEITTTPSGQSTSSEQTTTDSSDETTTSGPTATTTEQTQMTSTEQPTSTTGQTTQQSNQESTTENQQSTEQPTSTTGQTTQQSNQESTTENQQSTAQTESSTQESSSKGCPKTNEDEYLFVCPTSFRRHPKYCNLFYQCTEDEDTHESKIATFHCPNNTIYDESKVQCVEEKKADKKCEGEIAARRRVKRLGGVYKEPIMVGKEKMDCQVAGHLLFEKSAECSPVFLKCELTKRGNLGGFVYRCPEGFLYWSISRRCEQVRKIKDCKRSLFDWSGRSEIPIKNVN